MRYVIVALFSVTSMFGQGQTCNPDLFPKQNEKNRYWGFVNFFNQWEVTPIFTKVAPFRGNNAVVLKGTKYGVINCNGQLVVPCKYDEIKDFSGGKAWVRQGKLWGLVNEAGQLIHPVVLREVIEISRFSDAYWVDKGGEWGMYDLASNKYLFKPQFDSVNVLSHETSLAVFKGSYGLVSHEGQIIKKFVADTMYQVAPYRLAHRFMGAWGMIDYTGTEFLQAKFDTIFHKYKTILQVRKDGLSGLVDFRGNKITNVEYEAIAPFYGGGARVKKANKYGFISLRGGVVIPVVYSQADKFVNGRCIVQYKNHYGVINAKNKFVVADTFDLIEPTSGYSAYVVTSNVRQQLLAVTSEGVSMSTVYSFIDPVGKSGKYRASLNDKMVLTTVSDQHSQQYDSIFPLKNESYLCLQKGRYGVISTSGKVRVPVRYSAIRTEERKGGVYFVAVAADTISLFHNNKNLFRVAGHELDFLTDKALVLKVEDREALVNLKGERLSETYDKIVLIDSYCVSCVFPLVGYEKKWCELFVPNRVIKTPKANEFKRLNVDFIAYRVKTKWGVVRTNGSVLFKPKFDAVEKFEKGKFEVIRKGERVKVNKSGV